MSELQLASRLMLIILGGIYIGLGFAFIIGYSKGDGKKVLSWLFHLPIFKDNTLKEFEQSLGKNDLHTCAWVLIGLTIIFTFTSIWG